MIFVTGDTHIPIDLAKIMDDDFCCYEPLTLDDYVIICGDFGGVWNRSRDHLESLRKLNARGFTTLFIDGNHENFDMLNALPVEEWHGGKVHFVAENIIHLMRGQLFEIDGHSFFTMGGANSVDKGWRMPGRSWWPQEMPSDAEYEEAIDTLERARFNVDYVFTHTAPLSIIRHFYEPDDELPLCQFLERIKERTAYKKWFFGHVHKDVDIDERHIALYNRVVQLTAMPIPRA